LLSFTFDEKYDSGWTDTVSSGSLLAEPMFLDNSNDGFSLDGEWLGRRSFTQSGNESLVVLRFNVSHLIVDHGASMFYSYEDQRIFGLDGNVSRCSIFVTLLSVPVDTFLPPVLSLDFFASINSNGDIMWQSSSCDTAPSLQTVDCKFSRPSPQYARSVSSERREVVEINGVVLSNTAAL
jgi:hypothetical protein